MGNTNNNQGSISNGFFWKLVEKVLTKGTSFVVSVLLARRVAPEQYGLITLVSICVTFADVFVTSGFSSALIQKKESNDTDFSTVFICSTLISIFLYAILFFSAPFIANFFGNENLVIILRVFSLRLPLGVLYSVQHAYASKHMMFREFFYASIIGVFVSGVIGVYAAYNDYGVWALIIQNFTNLIINSVVLLLIINWKPRLLFSLEEAKSLLDYGWKILLADLSGNFFGQLRSIIIGRQYSAADLAFYDKGQQISSFVCTNFSQATSEVLFPGLSRISDDFSSFKELLRKSVRLASLVIFPVMGGIIVVARPMIILLYTEIWSNSIPFVQILSVGFGLAVIGTILFQSIKAIGRSDLIFYSEFIKKPIYLILLFYGIKRGTTWIAITMSMYDVIGTWYNEYLVNKYLGYSYKEQISDIYTYLLCTIIMMLFVSLINITKSVLFSLIIKVIAGIMVYIALLMLLKPKAWIEMLEFIKTKIVKDIA